MKGRLTDLFVSRGDVRLSELRALQSAHGGKQFHDESFPPKLRGMHLRLKSFRLKTDTG